MCVQDVLRQVAEVDVVAQTAKPLQPVTVVDCGVKGLKEKYLFPESAMDSTEDLD